jgi:uncharacterized protein YkwD
VLAKSKKKSDPDKALLDAHNELRKQHCAPALEWSTDLEKIAQAWADRLARDCSFSHSGDRRYGENLAAGTEGAFSPEQVVNMWYREVEKYDFDDGGFSMETGHFTQLVWKSTRKVGCGSASCKSLRIWVCNYDPPGNVERRYQDNVFPASCRKAK